MEEYRSWLAVCPGDKTKARCALCMSNFDIQSMGESAIKSHMRGEKHQKKVQLQSDNKSNPKMEVFFDTSCNSTTVDTKTVASGAAASQGNAPNESNSAVPATATTTATSKVSQFVSSNACTAAEILWALKVTTSHLSYHSCNDVSDLFVRMFPDSDVARKFSCAEKKCSYLCRFGLAPYFKDILLNRVKVVDEYVLMYDESLNGTTQNKQMDVYIRLWDINGMVCSRYIGSKFMGHGSAEQLLDKFNDCVSSLNLSKLVQISMDGPNVNWKLFELMERDLKFNLQLSILNIGSCNLHIVHGSFRDGANASGWELDRFMSNLYWLFKDSPARREDFTTVTDCSTFPLKVCSHRWLENTPVCERALLLLPQIRKYITACAAGTCVKPKNRSFEVVQECCSDKLITAKLTFCLSVSKQIEPFLVRYQTDKPMVPFLSGDLFKLIKSLMDRFIKPTVMKDVTSATKVAKIDLSKDDIYLEYSKVDIGFVTETTLKELGKKVTDRQLLDFRVSCKNWLKATVAKLLNKTAVQYSLANNLSCLDPRLIQETEKNVTRMKSILRLLVQCNRVDPNEVDEMLRQYTDYNAAMREKELSKFQQFDPVKSRVDSLLFETMGGNECYSKIWKVVRILLVLSHGQASVERGFSVNRQTETENLTEESFVAKRIICDYVAFVGGIKNINVTNKELILAASSARQKYNMHLEELKTKAQAEQGEKKKRAISDEIDETKHKKQRLEQDISSLEASADVLLTKAESMHAIKYVTEANSLRKTAKQKSEELKTVEQHLDTLLQQFRNN